MGNKQEIKIDDSNDLQIKKETNNSNNPINIGNMAPKLSGFYYFTNWLMKYKFYNNLRNSIGEYSFNQNLYFFNDINKINSIIEQNSEEKYEDENKKFYKLIKSMDKMKSKKNYEDFNYFSLSKLNIEDLINDNVIEINYDTNKHNDKLVPKLVKLLTKYQKEKPYKFQKYLTNGPPSNLRFLFYLIQLKLSFKFNLEIDIEDIYKYLSEKSNKVKDKRLGNYRSKISEVDIYIRNDKIEMSIANILCVLFIIFPKFKLNSNFINLIYYSLLLADLNEAYAFFLVYYILSPNFGLSTYFLFYENFPERNIAKDYLNELINIKMKTLFNKMKELKSEDNLNTFNIELLQNFFTKFPLYVWIRFVDCIIQFGFSFIFKLILALYRHIEDKLKSEKDIDQITYIFTDIYHNDTSLSEKNKFVSEILDNALGIELLNEDYSVRLKSNLDALLEIKEEKKSVTDLYYIKDEERKNFNKFYNGVRDSKAKPKKEEVNEYIEFLKKEKKPLNFETFNLKKNKEKGKSKRKITNDLNKSIKDQNKYSQKINIFEPETIITKLSRDNILNDSIFSEE